MKFFRKRRKLKFHKLWNLLLVWIKISQGWLDLVKFQLGWLDWVQPNIWLGPTWSNSTKADLIKICLGLTWLNLVRAVSAKYCQILAGTRWRLTWLKFTQIDSIKFDQIWLRWSWSKFSRVGLVQNWAAFGRVDYGWVIRPIRQVLLKKNLVECD